MAQNLLKIGTYVINLQCISHVLFNPYYSEAKVYLICHTASGIPCCTKESEGKNEAIELAEIKFTGEEADALRRYFSNAENVTVLL